MMGAQWLESEECYYSAISYIMQNNSNRLYTTVYDITTMVITLYYI